MTVKVFIDKLNDVYNDIDNFPTDETLSSAVKALKKLADKVGDIVGILEDEGITEEQP